MSKAIPSVHKYMTTCPHTIGQEQSLLKAKEIMAEYGIRHLPVLEGGRVKGLLSDRDIYLIASFEGVNISEVTVREAMTPDPYLISPDAALDEVAQDMAKNKYGSAIVVQNEKVVGVFTMVDALKALADLLHTRLVK